MPSPWTDLQRPPLSAARLQRSLAGGPLWTDIRLLDRTPSTNAVVAAAVRDRAAEGLVVVAEEQTAGRGRLDRQWLSPPRSGLLLSVLLRPTADAATWPRLTLLCGLAVVECLSAVGRVEAGLKWPNDVMVGGRKVAGLLAERVEDAVVVGIGVNVSTRSEELPTDTATSLALAGGVTDRMSLLIELLRSLARRYAGWSDTAGAASSVLPAYRERCETIGRRVSVTLPEGDLVVGLARTVDDHGRLVVVDDIGGRPRPFMVGDVTHLRPLD